MRALFLAGISILIPGCFKGFSSESKPFACDSESRCPDGLRCDDGVCCDADSTNGCPTLPNSRKVCAGNTTPRTLFPDSDGDTHGNPRGASARCSTPLRSRWATDGSDCDDANAAVFPGAPERPNGLDDNCDGDIDEGLEGRRAFGPDRDGDGSPAAQPEIFAVEAPFGYADKQGVSPFDCNDTNPAIRPGAPEYCNAIDDNCNGRVDDMPLSDSVDVVTASSTQAPAFPCVTGKPGICAAGQWVCRLATPQCESLQKPQAEVCDGLDNNCVGGVDERPACGGPMQLFSGAVRFGSSRIQSTGPGNVSNLTASSSNCPRDLTPRTVSAGTSNVLTLSQGTQADELSTVWFEAPDGGTWDLTQKNLSLQLKLRIENPSTTVVGGAWGTAGRYRSPVVFLCGPAKENFIRYVPLVTGPVLEQNDTTINTLIPLNPFGPDAGWVIGRGSGFDTSRVQRVEILFYPNAPGTYRLTFDPATGLVSP
jgi:Putative metal-binding motif